MIRYDRWRGHCVLKIPYVDIAPLICVAVSEHIVFPQDYIALFTEDRATWDTTVVIENIIFNSGIYRAGGRPESQSTPLPGCDSIFESGGIYYNCVFFGLSLQVNDRASLHLLIIHCASFSVIVLEINTWESGASDCQSKKPIIIGVKEATSSVGCWTLHCENIWWCNTIQCQRTLRLPIYHTSKISTISCKNRCECSLLNVYLNLIDIEKSERPIIPHFDIAEGWI